MQFVTFWVNLNFRNTCYCNAFTTITDLICALFGPYAATFVNRIYPGKSSKTSFTSPGKPWNLVFASPGKSWKTVFYCLYEPWCFQFYGRCHVLHTMGPVGRNLVICCGSKAFPVPTVFGWLCQNVALGTKSAICHFLAVYLVHPVFTWIARLQPQRFSGECKLMYTVFFEKTTSLFFVKT